MKTTQKQGEKIIDIKRTSQTVLDEFDKAEMAPFSMFTIHQMTFKEIFADKRLGIARQGLLKSRFTNTSFKTNIDEESSESDEK